MKEIDFYLIKTSKNIIIIFFNKNIFKVQFRKTKSNFMKSTLFKNAFNGLLSFNRSANSAVQTYESLYQQDFDQRPS